MVEVFLKRNEFVVVKETIVVGISLDISIGEDAEIPRRHLLVIACGKERIRFLPLYIGSSRIKHGHLNFVHSLQQLRCIDVIGTSLLLNDACINSDFHM